MVIAQEDIGETAPKELVVAPDKEAWVLTRLTELVELAQMIQRLRSSFVGASEPMITGAVTGAINGAAIEIIRTLGLHPSFTNVKSQPFNLHDRIIGSHIESANVNHI